MNKDSLLVLLLVGVVIAAGVIFFIFTRDDPADVFQPASTDLEGQENTGREARPLRDVGPKVEIPQPRDWKAEAAPDVAAEDGLEEDEAATLYGTVVNQDKEPVEGAIVALCVDIANSRAHSVLGQVAAAATTDQDGAYRISSIAIDERYAIRVEAPDLAPEFLNTLSLDGGESRRQDFLLQRGLELKGLVTDLEDNPLPGVNVYVYDQASRAQDPNMDVEKLCVTDPNGEFHCIGLNPGIKRVTAILDGFGTYTELGVNVFPGQTTKPVAIKLRPGGLTFAGKVLDAEDGLPVVGALVRAQPIASSRRNASTYTYPPVATDDDGYFTFVGIMPGSYRFRAFPPHGQGYPIGGEEVTALVPKNENTTIKLKRGPSVVGQVVDQKTGEPVERFRVTFSYNENALMDAPALTQRFDHPEGEFEYVGVQVNSKKKEFWLHATAKGYAGGSSSMLIQNGGDIEGVVIEMYEGSTATGKVVDSEGQPVRGASVTLSPQMGPPGDATSGLFRALVSRGMRSSSRRKGTTDADGKYRIEQVPEGWFKVSIKHSQYAESEGENTYRFEREGEQAIDDVILMKGATVRGRVLDKEGKPDPGARVQLRSKSQALGGSHYMESVDSTGAFVFRHVKPGIYTVTVTERGGRPDLTNLFQNLSGTATEIIVGDGQEEDVGDLQEP